MADLDVAESFRARPDQYAVPDLGMAVLVLLAGAAQRDAVQNRDVSLHHSGPTAYEPGGVIQENLAANPGCGMDVGLEYRRGAALQIIGKILAALLMQPMRQTVGLQRMKTLEVEQRVDETRGRGISVIDRHQIGPGSIPDIGILAQRLVIGLANEIARQRRMVETIGVAMHLGILQPIMLQHRRVDSGG